MGNLLVVAAGGAIGSAARHLVNVASLRAFGTAFPAGTFLVNVFGCLAMGVFVALIAERIQVSEQIRLFVATGFLGGFTTFSAFSLDFTTLWERGDVALAIAYAALSVGVSIAALAGGMWLVRALS